MNGYPSHIVDGVRELIEGRAGLEHVTGLIYEYQRAKNTAYARLCERRGVQEIQSWRDIPPVHVDSFRRAVMCTGDPTTAEAVFHTSGTTGDLHGTHHVLNLEPYRIASMKGFEDALLRPGMPRLMLSLIGPVDVLPHSSLARMVSWAMDRFGAPGSGYLESSIDLQKYRDPFLLLGTAFGLAECFQRHPALRLPPGSAIMETGGFKGRYQELNRSDLHALYHRAGVPSTHVVGEYGMTELSSQWYDGQIGSATRDVAERIYVPAPWARTRVLDAATMDDVAPGEVGLLCHLDPINIGSVQMILTSDIGRRVALDDGRDGFIYIGRASGAVIRGCSLMDEVVS